MSAKQDDEDAANEHRTPSTPASELQADGLLPCPFCGSAKVVLSTDMKSGYSDTLCTQCGATAPNPTWNKRATASVLLFRELRRVIALAHANHNARGISITQGALNKLLEDSLSAIDRNLVYPERSGDPACCPENEGYGCCMPNPPPQEAPAPVRAVEPILDNEAMRALLNDQRQLDEDGVIVGVSRQALDHVLHWVEVMCAQEPDTRRVASGENDLARELLDIRDGHFVRYKQPWHVLTAAAKALSASPTRAQAASAGEPVAKHGITCGGDAIRRRQRGTNEPWRSFPAGTPFDDETYEYGFAHAARTDGRSPNDVVAAYREVTEADVQDLFDYIERNNLNKSKRYAWLAALKDAHAVIKCDPFKDR